MTTESAFQAGLIRKLRSFDWVTEVMKNDAGYVQGFPDLTVYLSNGKWAMLECKRSANAPRQPNQDHYIHTMGECGFARFVYPENEEEVICELCQYASGTDGEARAAWRQQACLAELR